MPRHKAAKNCKILPWLSAKMDCGEGRFMQIGNSFLFSEKVQSLTAGSFRLYLCMASESGGKSEFLFTRGTAKKYGIAVSSFERQVKELCSSGFIERISDPELMQFAPGKYRFSWNWKYSEPAPHFEGGTP